MEKPPKHIANFLLIFLINFYIFNSTHWLCEKKKKKRKNFTTVLKDDLLKIMNKCKIGLYLQYPLYPF